jgi:hypothetical protein
MAQCYDFSNIWGKKFGKKLTKILHAQLIAWRVFIKKLFFPDGKTL